MVCDSFGNPVLLDDPASLERVDDFVVGFLASEARAVRILELAGHDRSAIVQAYCAALHMFAESPDGPVQARPFIDAALSRAPQASERERRVVAAIGRWVDGDVAGAIELHAQQAREFPRDLVSLKLGQYHLFNQGNCPGMLRMALDCAAPADDVPYLHGMLAFAWEQCHLLAQAETSARRALSMTEREPWAQHALAHVMLTQGRLHEGLRFMRECNPLWTGLNSFMVTHNWWHQALFALELGMGDEVLQLYDTQIWGVVKAYSQDQVGAVSLLARLELAGIDVGDRWQDVADHLVGRVHDHVLPFLDLQYLYGLARAARPEAQTMLGSIEAYCMGVVPDAPGAHARVAVADEVWPRVCLPAGRGLIAHAHGRYAEAAEELGNVLPCMLEVGGSHAQRDLFTQVYLDALMRSGNWNAAQQLVQPWRNGQPESIRLRRLAGQVYTGLGLSSAVTS